MRGVTYEQLGAVAVLTLDRPQARNAVDRQVATEMEAAIDRLEGDGSIRAGVLRAVTIGDRPVFCAGQDLKAFGRPEGNAMTERGGFAGITARARTKPLVVAVDGLATAGGCEIVLACDLVVASPRSSFGLAEVARGLIPASGGLYRLAQAVGRNMALRAALTTDPIPAERAYGLGLVTDLVPAEEVFEKALGVASRMAEHAPLAVREARALVLAAGSTNDASLQAASEAALGRLMDSDDLREGLRAFRLGRPPQWSGR
jgi:enoyl-CoA hydratase